MAKFKKGDRVKVKIDGKTYVGKVGDTYGSSGYFVDFDKNLVTPGKWGFKSGKDMMFSESQLTLANAVTSKNPVVANAMMARNGVKFDNPNYKAEDGIPFLDSHFDMFDKKVAKAMIEDAKKKGVRIPDSLMKKARESGILKNAVAKNAAISDEKELLRLVGTEMNQARAHLGNVIRNAKQGKAGGIKNFYTDHVSDLERIYNELWKF